MKPLIRSCMLATSLSGCLLSGCSRGDPAQIGSSSLQAAETPASDAGSPVNVSKMQTDDPCMLLTDAEVGKVFSGAASGERNSSLEGSGILTCVWDTPTDRFVVQLLEVGTGSVEDELRSRVSGSVDPLMASAGNRIRYETIGGVGDQAMLAVEKADTRDGIFADLAVMVIQRGERRAVLFTGSSLAAGERASGLKSLETLGRSAANRL